MHDLVLCIWPVLCTVQQCAASVRRPGTRPRSSSAHLVEGTGFILTLEYTYLIVEGNWSNRRKSHTDTGRTCKVHTERAKYDLVSLRVGGGSLPDKLSLMQAVKFDLCLSASASKKEIYHERSQYSEMLLWTQNKEKSKKRTPEVSGRCLS